MSLKRWVLGKVHGPSGQTRGVGGRRVAPSLSGTVGAEDGREPMLSAASPSHEHGRGSIAHLGPYAPLVAAIRAELEHFVESQLRLHLAIAERDRYVLTSIDVECEDEGEPAALLRRFVAEFKPEQIKRYLARDIIAGLRNASAIDLSQFAGLNVAGDAASGDEDDPYRDLVADLAKDASPSSTPAFHVALVGRWVQSDSPLPEASPVRARGESRKSEVHHTPLAGRTLTLEVEDANGARSVELGSVVPGRRYVIGKDAACDCVVDGVYASRRHCEIWFEREAWWVVDAGSTNGIRVEAREVQAGKRPRNRMEPIELPAEATIVLSGSADGTPRLYPRIKLKPSLATSVTAAPTAMRDATPITPLAPPRPRASELTIAARMASGTRQMNLGEHVLPLGVGRSREQALVIDRAHADVSGRHLEIVASEDAGAWVVVHGDNGVTVEGAPHGPGDRFLWKSGETMLLGRANTVTPACTLTLSRGAGA